MKNTKYHTVTTISQSNITILESQNGYPNTQYSNIRTFLVKQDRNCLLFASTSIQYLVGLGVLFFWGGGFSGIRVAHLVSFPCCVVFLGLFVFVMCLVYPLLPVSLDGLFLIFLSDFSNVYLFQ